MRRPVRYPLLLTTLALTLVAAGWKLFENREMASAAGTTAEAGATQRNDPTEATATPAAEAANRTAASAPARIAQRFGPLPPLDAPLPAIFAALKKRAEEGDALAACRLAAELDICASIDRSLEFTRRQLRQMDGPAKHPQQKSIEKRIRAQAAKRAERLLGESPRCEGAPPVDAKFSQRLHRQAALAGHLYSLSMYLMSMGISGGDYLNNLPELQQFRGEAEGLALRAAAYGDPLATLSLANAYIGDEVPIYGDWLNGVVRKQPALGYALIQRLRNALATIPGEPSAEMRQELDFRLSDITEQLSPRQRTQARALAQQMLRDWPQPQTSLFVDKGPPHDTGRDEFDAVRSRCNEAEFAPSLDAIRLTQ